MRSAIDWCFRSRETGRITLGQFPNPALAVFMAAWAAEWLWSPAGAWLPFVRGIGAGALAVWALDELLRGVNPWRRLLGGAVLAYVAMRVATGP